MAERPTTDGNPHAALLEACLFLLLEAAGRSDEDYARAQHVVAAAGAMSEQEVLAMVERLRQPEQEAAPRGLARYLRGE